MVRRMARRWCMLACFHFVLSLCIATTSRSGRKVHMVLAYKQNNVDILESHFWNISDPEHAHFRRFLSRDELFRIVSPRREILEKTTSWLRLAGAEDISLHQDGHFVSFHFFESWYKTSTLDKLAGVEEVFTSDHIARHVPFEFAQHFEHGWIKSRVTHKPSVCSADKNIKCASITDDQNLNPSKPKPDPNLDNSTAPIFCPINLLYDSQYNIGLNYDFWNTHLKNKVPVEDIISIVAVMPRCKDESFAMFDDKTQMSSCLNHGLSIKSFEIDFVSLGKEEISVNSPKLFCSHDLNCIQVSQMKSKPPPSHAVCLFSVAEVMPTYLYKKLNVTVRTVYSDNSRSKALLSLDGILAARTISPQKLRKMYGIPLDLKGGTAPNRQLLALPMQQYGFDYKDVQSYYDAFGEKLTATDVKLTSSPYKKLHKGYGEGLLDVDTITAIARGVETFFMPGDDFTFIPESDSNKGQVIIMANFAVQLSRLLDTDEFPFAMSLSYGFPELTCGLLPEVIDAHNILFMKFGVLGTSILVSSGDDGGHGGRGLGCPKEGMTPSFPTSSPHVTSVGGTQLLKDKSGVMNEVVCSFCDGGLITSGGGFSYLYHRPKYQEDAVYHYIRHSSNTSYYPPNDMYNQAGRAFPDISALATNYLMIMGSAMSETGGTSASAPLIAGMVSLINDKRIQAGQTPLGFLNPWLYKISKENKKAFKDVTSGDNRCKELMYQNPPQCPYGFPAAEGWDASTGLGVPNFAVLLQLAMEGVNSSDWKTQYCQSWNITLSSDGKSYNTCMACPYPYYLKDNTCVMTCGVGFYGDREGYGYKCKACSKNCQLCGFQGKCLQCKNSKYLKKGACVDTCDQGYQPQGAKTMGRKCIKTCSPLNLSAGVIKTQNCGTGVYTHCSLSCQDGYIPIAGLDLIMCTETGNWSGDPLTCVKNDSSVFKFCENKIVSQIVTDGYVYDGSALNSKVDIQSDCHIEFHVKPGSQFQLTVLRLPEGITGGSLKILDVSQNNNDAVLLKYDSDSQKLLTLSQTFISFGNKIKLLYSSGYSIDENNGIALHFKEYKQNDTLSICSCDPQSASLFNGTLVSGTNNFTSKMNCQTVLKHVQGQLVALTIHQLDLGSDWNKASLVIRDGNKISDQIMPLGTSTPQTLVATKGDMLISFNSESLSEYYEPFHTGFVATFESVNPIGNCDKLILNSTEEFVGSCAFSKGLSCIITCKTPAVAVQGSTVIRKNCSVFATWIGETHICASGVNSVCNSSSISQSLSGYVSDGTAPEEVSPKDLDCKKVISLPTQDALLINVTRFDSKYDDVLTIWDSKLGASLKTWKEGDKIPAALVSSSNQVEIRYTTNTVRGKGFTLNFEKFEQIGNWYALCNPTGLINADKGFLQPFPLRDDGSYVEDTNCSVTITASSGRLVLSLLAFKTDVKHMLEVRDGKDTTKVLATFSDSAPVSAAVVSSGKSLLVTFTALDTAALDPKAGKVLLSFTTVNATKANCSNLQVPDNVDQTRDCSRTENSTCSYKCKQGYVKIIGNEDRQCTAFGNWSGSDLICVNSSKIYKYTDGLNINSSDSYLLLPGLKYASGVKVSNPRGLGMTLLKADKRAGDSFYVNFATGNCDLHLSPSDLLPPIPYTCPYFSNDMNTEVYGGASDYKDPGRYILHFYEPEGSPICNVSSITGNSGVVISDRAILFKSYDGKYPSATKCSTTIMSSSGGLLSLDIKYFSLTSLNQYLYVYDGSSSGAPLLAKLSGKQSTAMQQITSTGQSLFLRFETGAYSGSSDGFIINFKAIPNKGVCKKLTAGINQRMNCTFGNKLCQFQCLPGFTAGGGSNTLRCRGDNSWDGKQPACFNSSQVFNLCSNSTFISRVGFVKDRIDNKVNYDVNLTCISYIKSPQKVGQILLTFDQFGTEPCKDTLFVYDYTSSPQAILGMFSGSTLPRPILSSGNIIKLKFITTAGNNPGFSFKFETLNTSSGLRPPHPVEPTSNPSAEPEPTPKGETSGLSKDSIIGLAVGIPLVFIVIGVIVGAVIFKKKSSKSGDDRRLIIDDMDATGIM